MSDELVDVRILRLPTSFHARATEHTDALRREFDLIRRADRDQRSVPHQLVSLIEELQERYGGLSVGPRTELEQAIQEGREELDLHYRVPPEVGDAARRLLEIFDQSDAYCLAGEHLLTLAAPPELVAYRRWFLEEFVRQVEGEQPTPWPQWLADHPVSEDSAAVPADTAPTRSGGDAVFEAVPASGDLVLDGSTTEPVVRVRGDLDLHLGPDLRELLSRLRSQGARRITVDLASSGFVDSVGISVLVSAHSRLESDGARLTLISSDPLRQVLRIAGVDDLLDVRDPA